MITSASGYEYVDVTGLSGFITGEILPKRDNRGDGSWRAMRYEDLLFLQEGKQERAYWFKAVPKVAPLGRRLDKYLMKTRANIETNIGTTPSSGDAVSMLYVFGDGSTDWYMNRDATLPVGIQSFRDTGYHDYDSMLVGYLNSKGASFLTDSQFETLDTTKRLISADDVRKAYFNLKKLSRTCHKNGSGLHFISDNTQSSYTYQSIDRDGGTLSGSGSLTDLGMLYYFDFQNWNRPPPYISRCYLYTYQYNFKDVITTLPYAKSAKLLLLVKTFAYDLNELDYYDTFEQINIRNYYDVLTYDCTVSNGAIQLPSIDTDSIASGILNSHSITRRTSVEYSLNDIAYVQVVAHCFVVDHEFPAEIDSLNWDWQPEEGGQ